MLCMSNLILFQILFRCPIFAPSLYLSFSLYILPCICSGIYVLNCSIHILGSILISIYMFYVWRCAMALVHQRIRRIFYTFPNPNAGALGSVYRLQGEKSLNHHYSVFRILISEKALYQVESNGSDDCPLQSWWLVNLFWERGREELSKVNYLGPNSWEYTTMAHRTSSKERYANIAISPVHGFWQIIGTLVFFSGVTSNYIYPIFI